MLAKSSAPSFMNPKIKRQETAATTVVKGAKDLNRFGSAMKDKSKDDNIVKRIQKFGASEVERNRKAEDEKKKKAAIPASVAPSKGFFGRMVDKYYYGKKDK